MRRDGGGVMPSGQGGGTILRGRNDGSPLVTLNSMGIPAEDPAVLGAEEAALAQQARILREMSPARKLDLVASHSRAMVELADADVRRDHPDWSDRRVRIEASRRWLPPDLHEAAFGRESRSWSP